MEKAAGGAKSPQGSKSADFLAAAKTMDKTWQAARSGKRTFEKAELKDGEYNASVVRANVGTFKAKKGTGKVPFIAIRFVILKDNKDEAAVGQEPEMMFSFDSEDQEKCQKTMTRLAQAIQALGYDSTELNIGDIPSLAEELTKDKPTCKLTAKNNNGFLNIYVKNPNL
jgi:hypothetical protein